MSDSSFPPKNVTILSWNTLSAADPWYAGWGCPLEQDRRDLLLKLETNLSIVEAQDILTQERYERIRRVFSIEYENQPEDFVSNNNYDVLLRTDILLFQELTKNDPWDDDPFFVSWISTLYERVPCQEMTREDEETIQRFYVRKDSGWKVQQSYILQTDVLQGGCLVQLTYVATDDTSIGINDLCDEEEEETGGIDCIGKSSQQQQLQDQNNLHIVNLHGKSGPMRNPDTLEQGMKALWQEILAILNKEGYNDDVSDSLNDNYTAECPMNAQPRLVLCGDWNTQLSDLPYLFANTPNIERNRNEWIVIAAMLDNHTLSNFSTNHEAGFLAQYDGCLLVSKSSFDAEQLEYNNNRLQLLDVSRNLTGFMTKGQYGRLMGDFSYQPNEGMCYRDEVLPGTLPSHGLSDHLRIYTSIAVPVSMRSSCLLPEPNASRTSEEWGSL